MSKTSKIKSVGQPKAYEGKFGKMFYFQLELENGDKGSLGSKSESPSWLASGQELEYDLKETDKGNQIKRVTPNNFNGKSGGYKPDTLGIAIGQGLNLAVEMFVSGKIEKNQIKSTASWIATTAYELREELKHLDK